MTGEIDLNAIADRYVAMWNEPDGAKRKEIVRSLWSPGASCLSKTLEPRGYDELDERAATAHERWVAQAGFRFFRVGDATGHHDVMRFRWKMAQSDDAEPESTGQDFFLLDDAGRIAVAYQFVDS